MGTYIGLDLAWTKTRETGYCYLEGGTAADLRCSRIGAEVKAAADLANEIAAIKGPVTVAIDAPMLYSEKRKVDHDISRRFGKYKAGAHSAHYAVKNGWKAGIELGQALRKRGFAIDPEDWQTKRHERVAIEVYPHTIHVQLFGLSERLRYKRGRVAERRRAMGEYHEHLHRLIGSKAEGLRRSRNISDLLSQDLPNTKGQALKRHDDTLDGLTCALAAWLVWHKPDQWETIGDESGYIVVPRDHANPKS